MVTTLCHRGCDAMGFEIDLWHVNLRSLRNIVLEISCFGINDFMLAYAHFALTLHLLYMPCLC